MINKLGVLFTSLFVFFFVRVGDANAHVTVRPAEVGVGSFTTFTVGVPNERDEDSTIMVRLVLPEGLNHVSPLVKPGWTLEIVRGEENMDTESMEEGGHDEAPVTELVWKGGSVPPGFKEEFGFSAQAPVEVGAIKWNAYQTYSDGSVVAWDRERDPEQDDFSEFGPYSQTEVVNDLVASDTEGAEGKDNTRMLSIVAIFLSVAAIGLSLTKRQ